MTIISVWIKVIRIFLVYPTEGTSINISITPLNQ
jgi:hypothetical protein